MSKKDDHVYNTLLLVETVEKRESTQLAWESIAKEVNDTG